MVDLIREKTENRLSNEVSADEKEEAYYQRLITENIQYIEKQCHKACGIYKKKAISIHQKIDGGSNSTIESTQVVVSGEVDADTLFNEVLDRLTEDNFKVLKNFENRSKLTTYITTIIAHLVVDIQRKQTGRRRTKERAKAMGLVGEKLYELIFAKGFPVQEAYDFLKENQKVTQTLEEIEAMVDKIRGRPRAHQGPAEGPEQPDIKSVLVTEGNQEEGAIRKQTEGLAKEVLREALSELSNEEKFIIQMRFPLSEDEQPKDLSEIAKILGTTTKAVDSRIRRIFPKLKEKMLRRGSSIDDFTNVYA
jgi:RNA polymerase sigma factor (sigma-70 family)